MTSRKGFREFRQSNPNLRYGQAFCIYFRYEDQKNEIFYEPDGQNVISWCDHLMNQWQTPER